MSESRARLEKALEELGIYAKKSLGQNFLVSDVVIERIIEKVKFFSPEVIIEVGPGPGALTHFLAQMKVPLTLIELDRIIAEYWRGKGFSVIEADALQLDWHPLLKFEKVSLVSNLPYQISSSIVIERSIERHGLDSMVLMFQKEVAQRIRASVKTENYGLLSVIAQTFWQIETVTDAGPRDFSPPPRVASRVLAFKRNDSQIKARALFLSFVKAAFAQRRKLLKSNLASLLSQRKLSEQQLIGWLVEMGFKETVRAEELSPIQFVELYKKFGFEG